MFDVLIFLYVHKYFVYIDYTRWTATKGQFTVCMYECCVYVFMPLGLRSICFNFISKNMGSK